jgi:hypothetical protein
MFSSVATHRGVVASADNLVPLLVPTSRHLSASQRTRGASTKRGRS